MDQGGISSWVWPLEHRSTRKVKAQRNESANPCFRSSRDSTRKSNNFLSRVPVWVTAVDRQACNLTALVGWVLLLSRRTFAPQKFEADSGPCPCCTPPTLSISGQQRVLHPRRETWKDPWKTLKNAANLPWQGKTHLSGWKFHPAASCYPAEPQTGEWMDWYDLLFCHSPATRQLGIAEALGASNWVASLQSIFPRDATSERTERTTVFMILEDATGTCVDCFGLHTKAAQASSGTRSPLRTALLVEVVWSCLVHSRSKFFWLVESCSIIGLISKNLRMFLVGSENMQEPCHLSFKTRLELSRPWLQSINDLKQLLVAHADVLFGSFWMGFQCSSPFFTYCM